MRVFHQIDGHYRSVDYAIEYLGPDKKWTSIEGMAVTGNDVQGWREHEFAPVSTEGIRILITRSKYGNRMGVGELEIYEAK